MNKQTRYRELSAEREREHLLDDTFVHPQHSPSKCFNPLAFSPMAVTFIAAVVYLAIFIPLLIIHETVPPAPQDPTLYRGLNLTEAWLDLEELSNGYHPFNSRRNDEIRNWLLIRIEEILDTNGVNWVSDGPASGKANTKSKAEHQGSADANKVSSASFEYPGSQLEEDDRNLQTRTSPPSAVIFNDLVSNYTSTALTSIGVTGRRAGISTYFEGNNIIVYIRGTEDEPGDWWTKAAPYSTKTRGKGGIMINAHFDSVSTGFGTTDDGMGVITTLQLIRYFTTEGNTPKRGVVVLLNNGEEDGLYGAKAFLSHPMASFVHAFLNLEGAGAGGRATLFRSTDTEVTRAYNQAPHPFGSVVSADGFALGFVRSETDYVVFRAEGYRGLDVAFWEPRARYHTNQDDTRHASKDSLWHMLSASVETLKYLTSKTDEFVGPRADGEDGKVKNGKGTDGVWFDLFGTVMAVFGLRTLFAWSLVLLIVSPLVLVILSYALAASDKYYLFTGSVKPDIQTSDMEEVSLKGWKGCFRFPITFIITGALTVGSAYLIRKFNPLIVYSSQYSVWTMSLTLFFCSFWFIMAGCNSVRPSALTRLYTLIWMFSIGWILLVVATVFEDRFKISGGYMFVIYESAVFLATFIGLCELFALPKKSEVANGLWDEDDNIHNFSALPRTEIVRGEGLIGRTDGNESIDEGPSERTPLIGSGEGIQHTSLGAAFARGYKRVVGGHDQTDGPAGRGSLGEAQVDGPLGSRDGYSQNQYSNRHPRAYRGEQMWSAWLPSFTWVFQFLILGPFILVALGQVGLLLVTATAQTGTDGSPLLLPYLIVALFSVLVILPLTPFIHRISAPVPTFLFIIFIGTLIYNLTAFPFSANNRYKAYFQQTVDLDSGLNKVTIVGIEEYVRDIISYIPSAAGQSIECTSRPQIRSGLAFCSYEGIAPKVIKNVKNGIPPEKGMADWLTYNVTRVSGANKATFHISGIDTKACIIRFDDPFTGFHVHGAAPSDGRWADVPESGSDQIKLWHRDWDTEWKVDVEWPVGKDKKAGDEGRSGRVVCLWSDHNEIGTIPALDEAMRFAPAWTSVVKLMDGLVEGSKTFTV